ncbi:hypothetical protein TcasGA2_TC001011 [Tribolium castaneum]|uniref:Uncharacterized protein n=1 Tax=Tribolium castaneum TaxID=7070 RepID=D6W9L3_TRICA|nr:PREDICTED: uncharacterized protein LOC107398939 [Tribolium castaneum]EEZ98510.2 hypothetical protein TcasGA2_TC001011 [Tribolium castaneum]|eukprot:XP_015840011.1 PREDICTED: uncharacterized protein LOC107398939 [Tribolium castaneum]
MQLVVSRPAMCYFLLIALLPIYSMAANCTCPQGFEIQHNNNQSWCLGTFIKLIIECSFIDEPECKCSDKYDSVLIDDEGYWCSAEKEGTIEKSRCENQDEWDEFYQKYNNSFYEE